MAAADGRGNRVRVAVHFTHVVIEQRTEAAAERGICQLEYRIVRIVIGKRQRLGKRYVGLNAPVAGIIACEGALRGIGGG